MIDPYLKVIFEFNKRNIKYIVIGVSGINYYARDAREIIMTGDYDIFLKPDIINVTKAIKSIRRLGYTVMGERSKIESSNIAKIETIIRRGKTLVCENNYHNLIDLCLNVSGYTFDELEKNIKKFKAGKGKICIASLRDLLKMKEIADRPQDKIFLLKYSEILNRERK